LFSIKSSYHCAVFKPKYKQFILKTPPTPSQKAPREKKAAGESAAFFGGGARGFSKIGEVGWSRTDGTDKPVLATNDLPFGWGVL